MATSPETSGVEQAADPILNREAGLKRQLSARQLSMMALGAAIGTGLFLGSAVSVKAAGPGVILSYAAGAVIALFIAWALAEMAVAHPVAGSFGVFAETYVHPWAGFAVRYSYWFALAVAIGSDLVAASIYCHNWFPQVPGWIWVAGFALGLIYINTRSVGNLGAFEYWFAMIKVATIVIFLVLGAALLTGIGFKPLGFANYTAHGGFLPMGWKGVGLGIAIAIWSYIGTETVAITSGEARDPEVTVPRALRSMVGGITIFYVGGMAILVGIMPWTDAGLTESPFVRVFRTVGIPAAAGVMNFVVLTAALSSVNTNLYNCTRMLFSLSRGGYAPKLFGRLSKRGTPIAALIASSMGMAVALVLETYFKESAYLQMLGVAFFGGLFAWMMIFVTHLLFRKKYKGELRVRAPGYPWTSLLGLAALVAITISTWWVPGLRITLEAGLPWLAFISVCYLVWAKVRRSHRQDKAGSNG
jgi:amino acid transporter, AAT family